MSGEWSELFKRSVRVYLVVFGRVRKDGAIIGHVGIWQRHLVVVVPVGVVVVGNLFRVRESGEPIAARGARAVERLVQDELAGVGLRRARRRAVD